jgi:DinB superfamily
MSNNDPLRTQLLAALRGGQAHITFDKVVEGFPVDRAGVRPEGMPHSAWELLEHIRIAQNEILCFSRSSDYEEMKWPDDYWPKSPEPNHEGEWLESIDALRTDLAEFERLVEDPNRDLYKAFPWGDGQTLLREALLVIDHNSYHLGQLLLVRRALEKTKV